MKKKNNIKDNQIAKFEGEKNRLDFIRVSYGKSNMPIENREYKIKGVLNSPVGTIKEIKEFCKNNEAEIGIIYEYNRKCPACRENKIIVTISETDKKENLAFNSWSRYTDKYICSDCGTREAFEGYFWK